MVTLDDLNALTSGTLPGLFGIQFTRLDGTQLAGKLTIRAEFMAPNGYLHAATVVALADTACGFGTIANLPENARGFTTIELKTNFLGTARQGTILCEAHLIHAGRTTQIWDAQIINEATGKTIALFRCTQMMLYAQKD
jgi:uncharacterized protein (TIGR00369 family)